MIGRCPDCIAPLRYLVSVYCLVWFAMPWLWASPHMPPNYWSSVTHQHWSTVSLLVHGPDVNPVCFQKVLLGRSRSRPRALPVVVAGFSISGIRFRRRHQTGSRRRATLATNMHASATPEIPGYEAGRVRLIACDAVFSGIPLHVGASGWTLLQAYVPP